MFVLQILFPYLFLNQTTQRGNIPGRVASRRDKGTVFGERTFPNKIGANNLFEILTIPFPIRYTASYEVVFWTSFQSQMNEMIQKVMTNYDGQGRTYKLQTDKGYYFVAYFEDEISPDDNLEDFTDEERVHKYIFNVTVTAYMLGNTDAGDMIPIRRYISAPQVSFDVIDGDFDLEPNIEAPLAERDAKDKFILDDIQELDQRGEPKKRTPAPDYIQRKVIVDPFSGDEEVAFVKVKSRNARVGETVISSRRLSRFEIP
jgi:hypothetical protein